MASETICLHLYINLHGLGVCQCSGRERAIVCSLAVHGELSGYSGWVQKEVFTFVISPIIFK